MMYKFDKDQLIFIKNWKGLSYSIIVVVFLIFAVFILGRYTKFKTLGEFEKELIILNVQVEKNKFTEEKFVEELKRLNIKFPYIVMAQSIIETGHWGSKIFKENHNLFGMKQANIRINTASGTQHNHAYYETWMESVYDYAFYQCRYLGNINSEAEYYAYLGSNYAEASDYVQVVKATVEKNKLKELF